MSNLQIMLRNMVTIFIAAVNQAYGGAPVILPFSIGEALVALLGGFTSRLVIGA
jgi:hypothetical protein